MKISLRLTRTFSLLGLAAGLLTTAHATPRLPSPLPIQSTHSIASSRAFETGRNLIVAGHATPALRTPAAHIDVQLVGPGGRVIATETDTLSWRHPRTAASRSRAATFTGGFPLGLARQAERIVITYQSGPHADCNI